MNDITKRTEISSLGEFGLIEHLTKNIELKSAFTVCGVGDDAAVIDNSGNLTVVTTDLLIENVHFDLAYTPLKHLGYKSIIVNLSDVYAMNARPKQVTVSIAVSNRFSVESLEELYEGIYFACDEHGVDLVGGDTSSSLSGLVISVTAIGEITEEKLSYRSGAKTGDIICVSGDLGASYVGLQMLEREKQIYLESPAVQPDLENKSHIIGKFLKPTARKNIIDFFEKENIIPNAMIDVSDGLSSDLLHICKQSKCGAHIYESKLPILEETYNSALNFNLDPTMCAMSGGEDYELLFTIPTKDLNKIMENPAITIIGKIVDLENGCILETKGGSQHKITAQGWTHL
ncbi:MAG: thiamine-phosphate kinase [Bacteroidetes bacterium]|nr:thiamine-phosphate kinase [Bacteroidota bacterium]MBP7397995.1 thiamine-phosphate kinase [Chitinophagales bacterium]MBK7108565.1 thiamine-phosphate kinase [Bacteroidota bacterium]MBK8489110.1 thiamine-phosphate kinase [Bacteroidota bacterium]MBK8680959.1 thiamine-phosphate kinase [Bacteroidota bacterium]